MTATTTTADTDADTAVYLADVLLLCTECGAAIKGRINTSQWIRVDFIGPEGECQACVHHKKGGGKDDQP